MNSGQLVNKTILLLTENVRHFSINTDKQKHWYYCINDLKEKGG